MKSKFSDTIEKGRIRHGQFESKTGEATGAFLVKHPQTKRKFQVIASDELGWDHVSVIRIPNKTPTWDEMSWIKSQFFEDDELALQYHPPKRDHINIQDHCLHIWRPQGVQVPMPPKIMV